MSLSRGLRNNNPGNIRITKDKWQGLREKQEDKSFFQFTEMKWGYRALIRTLQNYRKRHGCKTIADFIKRWAPENENDTDSYIKAVSDYAGIPADDPININDREQMIRIVAGMSKVENGREAEMSDVIAGWNLL